MKQIFNFYCDESSHLPNDGMPIMTLGLIRCPLDKTREIAIRLREIKLKHGLSPKFEIKWNKVSISKIGFYQDIVDYFFDDDDLYFRAVVAPKINLNHQQYAQSHDDWYYKMMFYLVGYALDPSKKNRIYLDKKDTQSAEKVRKLHDVLCNAQYDFNRNIIQRVQVVESHAVEQLQLADLLLGLVAYVNRGLTSNEGKMKLIERVKQRTGLSLTQSTLREEAKFNLFFWQPR